MTEMYFSGGGNRTLVYLVTKSGSTYAIQKPDNSGPAVDTDDALLDIAGGIGTTQVAPAAGSAKITTNHYNLDDSIIEYIDTRVAKASASSSTLPAVTEEDGTAGGNQATDGDLALVIVAGAKIGTKRAALFALCTVDPSSGGFTQDYNAYLQLPLIWNSIKPVSPITIPEELFPADKFKIGASGIGDQTIAANKPWVIKKLLHEA